jgi:hypothetical protein
MLNLVVRKKTARLLKVKSAEVLFLLAVLADVKLSAATALPICVL